MSTFKQAEASRINGAKSHGPVTPEGKLRVSQNAVKHGLLGKTLLLRGESPEFLEQFRQAFVGQWEPANDAEYMILEEIVAAKWRLRRIWSIETRLLQFETDVMQEGLEADYENMDVATRIALAYRKNCEAPNAFANLGRQEARLQRECRLSEKHLAAMQAARKQKEDPPPAAPCPACGTPERPKAEPSSPEIQKLQNSPGQPRLRLVGTPREASSEPPPAPEGGQEGN